MHQSKIQRPDAATEALLDMIDTLRTATIPEDALHAARRHLYDTAGVMLGGMQQDVSQALVRIMRAGDTPNGHPAPGTDLRLPAEALAFLTGSAGHGIELDDGYRRGTVHPGVAVIPAVLAASHLRPTNGEMILRATVAGYETVCALAAAMHPGTRDHGFHPTSVAGPMGAAVAVGMMLGLDRAQMSNALGLAASEAGGLFAFLSGGGDVKRLHGGKAARAGLLAAQCAAEGITAPPGIIGTPSGFAWAFAGQDPGKDLIFDLPPNGEFGVTDCYIKPHSCCRHLQPAFEALVHLKDAHSLTLDQIDRIEIETYSISAKHMAVGWGDFASAQLSMPYLMALAMRFGRADLPLFDADTRKGDWVAQVAAKLDVKATEEMDGLYPKHRPSRVRLHTAQGSVEETRLEALGSRDYPLDDAGLREKFRGLAALGKVDAAAWDDALWNIADIPDVGARLTALCGA